MALLWRSALLVTLAVLLPAPAQAAFDASDATERLLAAPPVGFEDTVALSGLEQPTAVRFAPDGRIFVAEKAGRIQVFDDFGDPTPTLYADLSREVHDFWDRGLLGMELDPGFATGRPYVYVLYAYDKDPNSPAFPRWGDECPSPPGAMEDGCVVTGRLSRLSGGFEQVLIEDWCQQYSSHSLGSLAFGADGALYASAGEGANYNIADWGQDGIPRNPCGDPPAVVGGAQTPPSAEGGALRAQDVLTPGDPTGLGGTVLRVDPDTGNPRPDNPGTGDPNARRIVAYGLRNPFRIATRPGTNEVWVGEVGWHDWEEIDRVPNPAAAVRNFGWPCYEGTGRMESYDAIDLNVCETLYSAGPSAHAGPYYTYNHQSRVVAGESCGVGSSSISGLAFTPPDSSFPPAYDGALFFADYSRDCIWAMLRGADGLPDPANIQTFVAGAENPVELQFGPNGDLYYVDLENGSVRRVRSVTTNHAPVARARADRSSGDVPLTVSFDGSASSDPDGQAIGYAWDLDGDGAFDDSTAVSPTFTYTVAGTYTARLRVTDPDGLSDTFNVPIVAGRPPVPVITITSPAPSTTWKVDDTIRFSGSATDASGAPIPAGGLTWEIHLRHCDRVSGSCHTHTLQSFGGVASGSFPAPDHEFPSYLEIELTARDARGLSATATRRLDPQTAALTLASRPAGARLTLGGETATAPFTRSVIRGSTNSIGAESPQRIAGAPYAFESWSNAGARTHTTQVNADTTLTATFNPSYLQRMAGTDDVGKFDAVAAPGQGEVYRTVAEESGTATELWLSVDNLSCASDLVLGLYADGAGRATTLLGSGRMKHPQPGWNKVDVNIPGIEAGKPYWIGVLNPRDGTCGLRWHELNRGSPEQWSASGSLAQLPTAWVPGRDWSGGPVSGYVAGTVVPRAPGRRPQPDNRGAPASPAPVTAPPPIGPVGEWGFDERVGRQVLDASGAGNPGTLSGATRTRGRFGGGLWFDGRNDWVTVAGDRSLDLTSGMTLAAWVRPLARGRTVVVKESVNRLSYGLYARPSGHVFTTAEHALRGRALKRNRWSHLAMTWDGLIMRVYVNGAEASRATLIGTAKTAAGPLRIGGNAIWPEFFKGTIDEVRIYDRALTAAEIVRARDSAITPGAPQPRAHETTSRGKPRKTRRATHRGTRWLTAAGAARSG